MSSATQEQPASARALRLRFGNFEVDLRSRELRKHGLKVKLQQRPFEVLRILLENRGAVISRDELRKRLWPSDVVVDFDHGLNTAVRKLRDALSDSAAAPRYIATVDRQGYRFVAPVTELPPIPMATDEQTIVDVSTLPLTETRPPHRHALRWSFTAIAVVALIGTFFSWRAWRPPAPVATGRVVVAVLPFENLTGDATQDYFIDGLTAEAIIQLGRLDPQRLGVISRSSVMQYKKGQEQLERIAGELDVHYVLEGTVRRNATHVRVTAELLQTENRTPLWAHEYDRELTSALDLQGEIAQEIADAIQLTLRGRNARDAAPPNNASEKAYDLYLKGRYFWNKRDPAGFQHAVDYFQQAIATDPNYARAYTGLADCYLLMMSYNLVSSTEYTPKARAAVLRALELDPNLAEAHTSLALLAESADWDWQTAGKEYRRAIALDPNYPTAHHWYAEYLAFEGRFDEALAESDRARQLDPLSLIIQTDRGAILYFAGQYNRAIDQVQTVLEMQPDFARAEYLLITCYVENGMYSRALTATRNSPAALRDVGVKQNLGFTWLTAYVYGRMGRKKEARRGLRMLLAAHALTPWNSMPILAPIYAAMNDKDDAIAWLEKGYAQHANSLGSLKVDHAFDPLRSDPRFQDLLRRIGLDH